MSLLSTRSTHTMYLIPTLRTCRSPASETETTHAHQCRFERNGRSLPKKRIALRWHITSLADATYAPSSISGCIACLPCLLRSHNSSSSHPKTYTYHMKKYTLPLIILSFLPWKAVFSACSYPFSARTTIINHRSHFLLCGEHKNWSIERLDASTPVWYHSLHVRRATSANA